MLLDLSGLTRGERVRLETNATSTVLQKLSLFNTHEFISLRIGEVLFSLSIFSRPSFVFPPCLLSSDEFACPLPLPLVGVIRALSCLVSSVGAVQAEQKITAKNQVEIRPEHAGRAEGPLNLPMSPSQRGGRGRGAGSEETRKEELAGESIAPTIFAPQHFS